MSTRLLYGLKTYSVSLKAGVHYLGWKLPVGISYMMRGSVSCGDHFKQGDEMPPVLGLVHQTCSRAEWESFPKPVLWAKACDLLWSLLQQVSRKVWLGVSTSSPVSSDRLVATGWALNNPEFNIFHSINWLSLFFLEFINSIIFLFCNQTFSVLSLLLSGHTYFSFLPVMFMSFVGLNLKISEYPNRSNTCDFFAFVCVFINMSK